MNLPSLSFVVLDTETTGFVPKTHRVIEYAGVKVENGEITNTQEYLFSIDSEIPPHVEVLTRIRPKMLEGKPTFEEKRPEIEQDVLSVELLVGQNLGYDIGMIKGEGLDLSDRPWIDTSMLASLVFPELASYSLPYMSTVLNLSHEPEHRALGDVHATLELLEKIWERLLELPADKLAEAKAVMSKCSEGYAMLFAALPESKSGAASWIQPIDRVRGEHDVEPATLTAPQAGTVSMQEEGLAATTLQRVLRGAVEDTSRTHWIAVKNLDHALERFHIPDNCSVIYPPNQLLDADAATALAVQETYTLDEALLTLKIRWFNPRTRSDIAVHGNEKDVWTGKLACTSASKEYIDQFATKPSAYLLDHWQMLWLVHDATHPAHALLTESDHVIIDDASMLEDTATKAYGHFVSLDSLRAGASGDDALEKMWNLLALWTERTRSNNDQYFLNTADYSHPETASLVALVQEVLARANLPAQTKRQLEHVEALLDATMLEGNIVWIERRKDGALSFQSAPTHVDVLLKERLFDAHPTTLLVPKGATNGLPEVVPVGMQTVPHTDELFDACPLTIECPTDTAIRNVLDAPPQGKTIILAGSKRVIEQYFVDYTEKLEELGVTLICQGMNGGRGRMQAEFEAATAPAILIVTTYMYEGLEFSPDMVSNLYIDAIPFDSPSHPVIGKRSSRYQSGFMEYSLPRAVYRVFRLIRAFCRHNTSDATITVLDKRLTQKAYGKNIQAYLEKLATPTAKKVPPANDQMSLL